MNKLRLLSWLLISATLVVSCKEETDDFSLESIQNYSPLSPGKYITYRVDSLVFTNFGRNVETHEYLVKHVVDAEIKDGQNRTAYRIHRYIKADLNGATSNEGWAESGTYTITPLSNRLEVMENNLRMVKLQSPLREGFSWKGNSYLSDEPYDLLHPQNNYDEGMKNWDYVYGAFEPAVSFEGENYQDVWTITSADVTINVPIVNNNQLSLKRKCEEKFAKGIGLVFRQHELWERQPNLGGSGGPYYLGFGITMWMVDHN